jgi:hypothetical protein
MPRLSKIGAAALAAFGWTSGGVSAVTANYLVVAGGAGGGGRGGGGAGGFRTGTTSLDPTLSYTAIVGGGGNAGTLNTRGTNGSNSEFSTITSAGGGGGGAYDATLIGGNGRDGGSGGGAGGYQASPFVLSSGGAGNTPTQSPSQGNNGGASSSDAVTYTNGGGGGGASAAGANATAGANGAGGAGTASSISGSSVTYAGGGGGGGNAAGASGGAGGGGNGGGANAGTVNTGGGGGGVNGTGGTGGSGIVIISYPAPQQFGGGIVTTSGGNVIHTFTTSGTLSPLSTLSASYLIVAGGGAGGGYVAGGGGAGGLLSGSGVTIDTNSTYLVTVGAGAPAISGSTPASNGGSSAFSMVTTAAVGGGRGAQGGGATDYAATSGGSGGGGGATASLLSGAAGTAGQGNAGGNAAGASGNYPSGGGGGAGAVGQSPANTSANGGNGGVGVSSSISGAATFYAGGGGGGALATAGTGGNGGGGAGGSFNASTNGTAGTANTGGGGGGGGNGSGTVGGSGGSGIVIISYPGTTQLMAGGTVTISGGNVIHTFTSSGYLTPLTLVGNSLRFRRSASAFLNRTPTVSGNRKTWTFSAWVKRGALSIDQNILGSRGASANEDDSFTMQFSGGGYGAANDTLVIGFGNGAWKITSQVFRDPAAWYHIVLAFDSTQATAANRLRLFVNGTQVTAFSTDSAPTLNLDSAINKTIDQRLGSYASVAGQFIDGYLAEVNLIDGQALTPNSFGTFNQFGVWQPIRYGGSYGTNGFYLPFTATQSFAGTFSGSSQWVSVPNLAAFSVGTSNYTVEGWFYFNSLPATQGLFGCNNGSGSTSKFLGTVLSNGSVALDFTNSGGPSFLVSSAGVVTTGRWYHIAFVRNSGTTTIYVNGTSVGSTGTSLNLTGLTQAWNIGYIGEAGPSSLAGLASNFRLVTGTAVYTSNFIPQTTPLTAISGTQILTLQNATLVDNSTNAQVVTNTGGVTVAGTYPFAILNNTVRDFGPAGNNWTANNIGQATGSTLDTMTDVPTLTSTTAANYATLNPLNKNGNATLSNANLTVATAINDVNFTASTIALVAGNKSYFELTCQTATASNFYQAVGIWSTDQFRSFDSGVYTQYYAYDARATFYNGSAGSSSYGATWTNGDVIGVAVDMTNGSMVFYKNGVSQGTATTSINTALSYYATIFTFTTQASINFGQQPFVYTPPSGFLPLNTFNL